MAAEVDAKTSHGFMIYMAMNLYFDLLIQTPISVTITLGSSYQKPFKKL